MTRPPTSVVVLMGPAGAGKTTIGAALAAAIGWRFIDADDLHSVHSVDKMRHGEPLTDADRRPWLDAVHRVIVDATERRDPAVVACSALTNEHRRILASGVEGVRFVYLRAAPAVLDERLRTRRGHFARAALLPTQLATLEEPDDAITIDAEASPGVVLAAIRRQLKL